MSWDCPYWNNDICELNGMLCTPGKGHCVLRNRFEIISGDKNKNKKNKFNKSSEKQDDKN
jgi:hypothetical protein